MVAMQRRPPKPEVAFEDRLAKKAAEMRARAQSLPSGEERDRLLQLVRQCETAAYVNAWLTSPGLGPPGKVARPSNRK